MITNSNVNTVVKYQSPIHTRNYFHSVTLDRQLIVLDCSVSLVMIRRPESCERHGAAMLHGLLCDDVRPSGHNTPHTRRPIDRQNLSLLDQSPPISYTL